MAVFIPKNRLGSGPPPRERRMMQRVESTPGFQNLQRQLAEAKQQKQEAMDKNWDSNAEVQKWRGMTKEEQARDAIERLVPTAKAVEEAKTGKECSYEDARKVSEKIAYRKDAED